MRCPNCQLEINDHQSKMYGPTGWCHTWCYSPLMTAFRKTLRRYPLV